MDETNKEEALRCLKIAKNQFGSKNYEAAVRLAKKSLALYTTEDAQEFLKRAQDKVASGESSGSSTSLPQQPSKPTQEKREAPSAGQQSMEVREILACGTDYYKVLNVNKKCTEVEIKKSYRKVSIHSKHLEMGSNVNSILMYSLLSNFILTRTRQLVLMKLSNVSTVASR